MSHDDRRIPKFAIGERVCVFATGQVGTVAHHLERPDGQLVLIVDIPQGQATLRRHFNESEIEAAT
ncbi:MAG TPA: hypothetical protein P5223_15180 [Phycisphaerae bacterium]|nr:hypothetical protein [Phycisphaerae bacterium]